MLAGSGRAACGILAGRAHKLVGAVAFALVTALLAVPAQAGKVVEVELVSDVESGRFEFVPPIVRIEVGDRVRFVASSRVHSTRSIVGMLPPAGKRWKSALGHSVTVTFPAEGVYGFQCPAYYQMGMVGLVLVGHSMRNWADAQRVRHPDAAASRFEQLFTIAACMLAGRTAQACGAAGW